MATIRFSQPVDMLNTYVWYGTVTVANSTTISITDYWGTTGTYSGYGITYSGKRAAEGRTIAVDPDIIPLGTKVWIDGICLRTAEDIGSAIQGNRIDVFMNDVGEALEFGVKKNVKVYVLEEEIGA